VICIASLTFTLPLAANDGGYRSAWRSVVQTGITGQRPLAAGPDAAKIVFITLPGILIDKGIGTAPDPKGLLPPRRCGLAGRPEQSRARRSEPLTARTAEPASAKRERAI